MRKIFFIILNLSFVILPALPAGAQVAWQANGVPVCTAASDQMNPMIVPDIKGGGIVVWQDWRSGSLDIYAQRVDSSGHACWAADGVPIAASPELECDARAISDMRGGAIVVFNRGNYNVWIQRVDSLGNACWGVSGEAVSNISNSRQGNYKIASDSAGGGIVTWMNGDTLVGKDWDVYAQRIDSAGNIVWGANGIVVAGGPNDQGINGIVADGGGGAIIFWDSTNSFNCRAYADRIGPNGNLLWALPAPVCTLLSTARILRSVSTDSRGGGIIVWQERRISSSWYDVYAQRVDSSGNVKWQLNGLPVCTAAYNQEEPVVIADGCGGGIIAWDDNRDPLPNTTNIYAQRIDSAGNAKWTLNGALVCSFDSVQVCPCITTDGQSGAIVSWFDGRSGYADSRNIFGQWIDSSGNNHWSIGGLAVCTAPNLQWNDIYNRQNQIISVGVGGAILVWHDYRNGDADIYAQRIGGPMTGVAENSNPKAEIRKPELYQNNPNPFGSSTIISYQLPVESRVYLKIYNITGQLVKTLFDGAHSAGAYGATWDGKSDAGEKLPSGIYFYQLKSGNQPPVMKKMMLLR